MDSARPRPDLGSTEQRARRRRQLASAERRLADAKSKLLNVSAFSDGNSWGAIDPRPAAGELNARIVESQGIAALEEEIARLRQRVESTRRVDGH